MILFIYIKAKKTNDLNNFRLISYIYSLKLLNILQWGVTIAQIIKKNRTKKVN